MIYSEYKLQKIVLLHKMSKCFNLMIEKISKNHLVQTAEKVQYKLFSCNYLYGIYIASKSYC